MNPDGFNDANTHCQYSQGRYPNTLMHLSIFFILFQLIGLFLLIIFQNELPPEIGGDLNRAKKLYFNSRNFPQRRGTF